MHLTALDMAKSRLPAARFISCCRIEFIAARQCIRTKAIQASMRPSSMKHSGVRSGRSSQKTAPIAYLGRPKSKLVYCPASYSTHVASGCLLPMRQRITLAIAIMFRGHCSPGSAKDSGQRIPASNLEARVIGRIHKWLGDRAAMLDIIQSHASDVATQKRLMVGLEQCLATWSELKADDVRKFMLSIVARIQVHADRIDILLNPMNLARWFGRTDSQAEPIAAIQSDTEGPFMTLTIPARLKRVGKEMKILIEDGSDSASPDTSLVRVLVRAHVIRDRFLADKSATLDEIAKSVDIVPSYVTRLFRLTLLAPDIVSAILAGKHPPELNARKLLDDTRLPLDWNEQRRSLEFA